MTLGTALVIFIALLVTFIVLEGKRQERIYGKTRGIGLAQAGLLELQRHLQPERKIEVLLKQDEETEADAQGDPPVGGGRSPSSER